MLNTNPESYSLDFPYFRKPVEYGTFSVDKNAYFSFNNSALKTLDIDSSVAISFDLNQDFDSFHEKESTKNIDRLLKWILRDKAKLATENPEQKQLKTK